MTQERMNELAEQLESKAESVLRGFYGKDDDDESWYGDLRRAAKRLRRGAIVELNNTDIEEIACGTDADAEEVDSLREPVIEEGFICLDAGDL